MCVCVCVFLQSLLTKNVFVQAVTVMQECSSGAMTYVLTLCVCTAMGSKTYVLTLCVCTAMGSKTCINIVCVQLWGPGHMY